MSTGIPLSWLQLTREKRRFAAALAGISFAVVLMLMQLGFEDALLSSVILFHSHLIGELVIINPQYQNIIVPKTFTERRLYQALGCDGVESVEPVYVSQAPFKNPFDRSERNIFLVGFNPHTAVLRTPGVAENLDKIRIQGQILFDSIRRPEFGPVAETFLQKGPLTVEVNGRRLDIVGLLQLGTSFAADGNLIMSDETFLRVNGGRQRGIINIGLITLKPGANMERVKAEITAVLPPDARVMTSKEFSDLEMKYWVTNTPIGFVFRLGVMMGIFVGCIIVYQILYSDVSDHLPEYATLKAIGYPNSYLFKLVMQESLILSILGFLPGIVISHFVYRFSQAATQLPLQMTLPRTAGVYFLTLFMCALSGILAARRLKAADPADIF
jgi:putative ABC transport system permease protein